MIRTGDRRAHRSLIPAFFLLCVGTLASASSDGIVYENSSWGSKSIRVCFGDTTHQDLVDFRNELDEDEQDPTRKELLVAVDPVWRARIQSWITTEYTVPRLGVAFTGFQPCSKNADEAQVLVFFSNPKWTRFTSYGMASYGPRKPGKTYVILQNPAVRKNQSSFGWKSELSLEKRIQITALHEFGHILGLDHENDRISLRNADVNCLWTLKSYYVDRKMNDGMLLEEEEKPVGVYDPNSISNYCYTRTLAVVTGLSFTMDRSLPVFSAPSEALATRRAEDLEGADPRAIFRDYAPERNAEGLLPYPRMNLKDPTLSRARNISPGKTQYKIRIGLSLGDIHAIRCAQGFYPQETRAKRCHLDFDPTKDRELLALFPGLSRF